MERIVPRHALNTPNDNPRYGGKYRSRLYPFLGIWEHYNECAVTVVARKCVQREARVAFLKRLAVIVSRELEQDHRDSKNVSRWHA